MYEYIIEIMICLLKKGQNPPPKKRLGEFWFFRGMLFSIISEEGPDIQQPVDKTAK